ncbi:MAG TPA: twin-arginine translocase TatA/TatE family subunit [Actinomycetota bacterium]|jgi:TatA/E family protein of Tat protein translocase
MFDVGPEKLLIILAVALLVVGPKRIPEIARSLGASMRSLRDGLSGSDHDEHEPPTTSGATPGAAGDDDPPAG